MVFAQVLVLNRDELLRGSHGLSARRARRMQSRGSKGLQLEVGARRASTSIINIASLGHPPAGDCQKIPKLVNKKIV